MGSAMDATLSARMMLAQSEAARSTKESFQAAPVCASNNHAKLGLFAVQAYGTRLKTVLSHFQNQCTIRSETHLVHGDMKAEHHDTLQLSRHTRGLW